MTVLDFITQSLRRAADYNSHDVGPPRAVIWTDVERIWQPVIVQVRGAFPHLWSLGDYKPEINQGPAAYLRFAVETECPVGVTPVLYLPGVSRSEFRSAASMKEIALHLFALQYESQFWTQKNSKDWTPLALLSSTDGGLGMDVAQDVGTRTALTECLAHLLTSEVADLRNGKIEAADIRALVAGDPIRMLLKWIGDALGRKKAWEGAEWKAFRAVCKDKFSFDPDKDGVITAAERLARGEGPWAGVWQRFKEAPKRFAGVKEQLENVQPDDLFGTLHEGYPRINRREEDSLRKELMTLENLPQESASQRLDDLVKLHVDRAGSVWADVGDAPLARSLQHFKALIANIKMAGFPHTWEELATMYHDHGWLIDSAAIRALAEVREAPDFKVVSVALRAVYLPWLEKCAHHVQQRAADYPNSNSATTRTLHPEPGTIYLFVDGLRYDVARRLAVAIGDMGLIALESYEWAAMPTVTATSKPAWQPLAQQLRAADKKDGFEAAEIESGKEFKAPLFRKKLEQLGFTQPAWGDMADANQCAWVEVGQLDRMGHDEGAKLAWRVQEEIQTVASKVKELLSAGWLKVRLVTDHGWLLMPGGLPKVDLPKHLTESRWGRCALPGPEAQHGFPAVSWFWDSAQPIAVAPGVSCFLSGKEYSHGGLSLQEALLPVIVVERSDDAGGGAGLLLTSLRWKNLRLVAEFEGANGLRADVRKEANVATSLLSDESKLRQVATDGSVSVLVEDDDRIGESVLLVLVNSQDEVVFKREVVVGEN
ncbi:BREX-1 system phosphatase PglZ type B [bacterium]|nr:BREX-1 system phosphatase PglZ type B [bacterium]